MKMRTQFSVPTLQEDMKHRDTLLSLLKERAYKHGNFTLSSGIESEHYVNCKPVTLSCEGNALLSHLLIPHVEKDAVAVGGLTLGADPLVVGIAQKAYYKCSRHIDALIIRKNPKGYGTKEVIEGNKPPKGSVITVLEDVTTTGNSAMIAVNVLRNAGYKVNRVVAIVDRMDDHSIWNDAKIDFKSLYTLQDLINA
tara:strand:+ start:9541 stop:10128 length:588 start_codon:yes stop_codon:yes gene_type:complete